MAILVPRVSHLTRLKDGVVNERACSNLAKIAKESNNLAKVLLEPNQKSNELSMNRKCGQRYTTDDLRTFMKFLGADKNNVRRNQSLGNNCKIPCLTEKVAFVRVKINVIYIYIVIVIFI